MLDIFLGWFVIAIPFLLAVGATVLTLRLPSEKHYWKFLWGAVLVGLLFSVITYWQQVRAARLAEQNQQTAIDETAKKVAKQTTDNVTDAVGKQYKEMIASLTAQNQSLASQLSAQGKDVNAIKSSSIVTGKKPIKVEVTNPSQPSPDGEHLPNISWTQEEVKKNGNDPSKPITRVQFKLDDFLKTPAFIALCDKPCKVVGGGLPGMSMVRPLMANSPRMGGAVFMSPRPMSPAMPAWIDVTPTEDDTAVKITGFRILKEAELPLDAK